MREFNMKRPARRSFNAWIADFEKLSGKRDVSQEGGVKCPHCGAWNTHAECGTYDVLFPECKECGGCTEPVTDAQVEAAFAADYAAAECAEGRWREDHPNDPTEC